MGWFFNQQNKKIDSKKDEVIEYRINDSSFEIQVRQEGAEHTQRPNKSKLADHKFFYRSGKR